MSLEAQDRCLHTCLLWGTECQEKSKICENVQKKVCWLNAARFLKESRESDTTDDRVQVLKRRSFEAADTVSIKILQHPLYSGKWWCCSLQ